MLPDSLFHPLKLDAELADAREVSDDAAIALLEEALTDPRAHGDETVGDYLARLVEIFEEIGPSPEAFACLQRIGDATPELATSAVMHAAGLHLELGENDDALGLLTSFHAKQALLPTGERAWNFYPPAALYLSKLFGDHERAALWVAEGLELVRERGILEETQSSFGYVQDLIGDPDSTSDPLEALWNAKPAPPADVGPKVVRMAYFPEAEYTAAWERGFFDPTIGPVHVDYRRTSERYLRQKELEPGESVLVVPLDMAGLFAYAAATGKDPDERQTRLDYGDSVVDEGRGIPWPPERNALCWCGSTRKYKKCCGAPGFPDVDSGDPASIVLKVELDGAEPPVWRRFEVPSELPMHQLHEVIQAHLGREPGGRYVFVCGATVITNPETDRGHYRADEVVLISCFHEPGESFSHLHDFEQLHTVTVEEVRPWVAVAAPILLDGAGVGPFEQA
jgi:hypothetical protein